MLNTIKKSISELGFENTANIYSVSPSSKFGGKIGWIQKNQLSEVLLKEIMQITSAKVGDSIFFACGKIKDVEKISSLARDKIAKDLDLIDDDIFAFCWIVDYPMFERNEITNKIEFSHNPFSMPQGGLKALEEKDPLVLLQFLTC